VEPTSRRRGLGPVREGTLHVDDPSHMLVTVAAEDVFDACPQQHHITAPTLLVAGDRPGT
jgi:hypothetical protein